MREFIDKILNFFGFKKNKDINKTKINNSKKNDTKDTKKEEKIIDNCKRDCNKKNSSLKEKECPFKEKIEEVTTNINQSFKNIKENALNNLKRDVKDDNKVSKKKKQY